MNSIAPADSDSWNNAEGKSKGLPVLIRYRPNLKDFLGDPRYPRLLTITWRYETDFTGLPTDEIQAEMKVLEDSLDAALDPTRLAILAFIQTHGGVRRWHYYIADLGIVAQRINEALSGRPNYPIDLEVEDDPEWNDMRLLLERCR